ncbi:MAG: division/cell wall cluster transcriptional repressor MraZ [Bacteroidota bacterium]
MGFFSSEYECKLDAKGRLVLPSKIKSNLPEASGNQLVIRRGFEPCLVLYPTIEYKKLHSKIAGLSEFNAEYRKIQRNFFRGTQEVELDSTGRLLVPKSMMLYAGLEREAMVVGMGSKIEVWNPERYNEYLIQDQEEFSELAQKYLDE